MTPTSWALYISSSLMFDKRYHKTGKDPEDISRAFKVWKSYNTRSDQAAWDFSSWKSNGRRSVKWVHGREQLLSVSSRTQKFSKENLLHKGLKQFKEAFLYRSYSSAMETLDAEHCNCWKFTSIKKKKKPTLEKSAGDKCRGNCWNNGETSLFEVSWASNISVQGGSVVEACSFWLNFIWTFSFILAQVCKRAFTASWRDGQTGLFPLGRSMWGLSRRQEPWPSVCQVDADFFTLWRTFCLEIMSYSS